MAACDKNVVKIGRVVFELCERTDRQTDKQIDMLIAILFSSLAKRLAGKSVSEMTRFASSGTLDLNSVSFLKLNG